jgi:putative nucleotidyltransferase with HDIG domain
MTPTTSLSKLLPAFGNAMVAYHRGTAQHSERVGALARSIGVEIGVEGVDLEVLHWAGLLHDIGKLAVPEEILTKPGRLTPEEWIQVQRHPAVGSELLRTISSGLEPVAAAVRAHHERWDGSGYPDGLAGEDIPLAGRIVTVADVYDALTHPRAYRRDAYTAAAAIEFLVASVGRQFDRRVVEAFRVVLGIQGATAAGVEG